MPVSPEFADEFVVMRDAFVAAGENEWTGGAVIAHSDPVLYLETLRSWSEGKNLPPKWGPADSYLIFAEDVVVGQIDVRHPLTEHLIQYGGHVGYHVHPGYRNRGIASWALHTALSSSQQKGLPKRCSRALMTTSHRSA